MKKLIWIIAAAVIAGVFPSCNSDDNNLNDYLEWKKKNIEWIEQMAAKKNPDGTDYYTKVVPDWYKGGYVLMHYFNDRSTTAGNLSPLYTSTVDVRYIGYDCEDEPFDSSYTVTTGGVRGVARFQCNGVIPGWSVALMDMHVGDSAEIVIPYEMAYNTAYTGTILPYSALRFNVRLEDIYRYEAKP